MRKQKMAAVLVSVMAAAMMLSACGGSGSSSAPTTSASANGSTASAESGSAASGNVTKDDIIIANSADIKSMDPAGQSDDPSSVIIRHMYNGLTMVNDNGVAVGDLAESFEMIDDTTYHFKLREGVKFHDGSEMKASDVKFSLERCMEMPKTKSNSSSIESVSADDDYNVTVKLKEPFPSLPYILSNPNMMIVSEKAVTEATNGGNEYGEAPVGTGPFKFVEWIPNDHWTIERNEDYFMGAPIAHTITCKTIPEGSARCIALETGEVDLILNVEATDAPNIEANQDLLLESGVSPSVEYLGMNTQKETLSDVRVRQAIAYALDKQQFVDTIIEGRGEVANSFIGKTIPGWDSELEPYPYDPEKAKELLAEAGFSDGFDVKLYVSGDVRNRSAQIIQAQLKEVGINVDISLYEWGAFLDSLNAGEHDMFILGWSNGTCDPEHSITPLFHSRNCGASGNRAFLQDDKMDAMIDEACSETDNDKRIQDYKDIQAYLKEVSPWVPLYFKDNMVGRRADLKGFTFDKNTSHYIGDCHYEE